MTDPDFYALIKVPPTASDEEIRAALRNEQRHWGRRANNAPLTEDRNRAQLRVEELGQAEKTLTNPAARAAYDYQHGHRAAPAAPQSTWVPPPQPPQFPPNAPFPNPYPPPPGPAPPYIPPFPHQGVPPGQGPPSAGLPRRKGWWSRHKALRTVLIIVGILWILGSVANALGRKNGPLGPKTTTTLPTATRQAVSAVVLQGLQSCAKAALLVPANCPQNESAYGATGIVWTLHGDPMGGAEYETQGGKYVVKGHAAMTLQYTQNSSPTLKVVDIGYAAVVNWTGAQGSLDQIQPLQNGTYDSYTCSQTPITCPPRQEIVKAPSGVTDQQVNAALRAQFGQCLAARTASQPVDCPVHASVYEGANYRWTSTADPLLNSRITYDSSYGIIHVVGSYVMTLSYSQSGSPGTQDFSGQYDAQLTVDNGTVVVLAIAGGH